VFGETLHFPWYLRLLGPYFSAVQDVTLLIYVCLFFFQE
jgi:hypothetical protein